MAQLSQPGVTEGWRPDVRREKEEKTDVTPADCCVSNLRLNEPCLQMQPVCHPIRPSNPFFFFFLVAAFLPRGATRRGDYNDNLVNADAME